MAGNDHCCPGSYDRPAFPYGVCQHYHCFHDHATLYHVLMVECWFLRQVSSPVQQALHNSLSSCIGLNGTESFCTTTVGKTHCHNSDRLQLYASVYRSSVITQVVTQSQPVIEHGGTPGVVYHYRIWRS